MLLAFVIGTPALWAAGAKVEADPPLAVAGSTRWVYTATLDNGFSIRHYHREVLQDSTRLYLSPGRDSFVDVPTTSVVELQKEELPAAPPVAISPGAPSRSVQEAVSAASDRHQIDADLLMSIIRAESGFNQRAVSRKGAQGLMQLMPATAAQLGVADAFNPADNVEAGTRHLRELLRQYNGDLVKALAAYNAGSGPVARYNGVPPYPETRAYVGKIIREFNRKKLEQRARSKAAAKSPSKKKQSSEIREAARTPSS